MNTIQKRDLIKTIEQSNIEKDKKDEIIQLIEADRVNSNKFFDSLIRALGAKMILEIIN